MSWELIYIITGIAILPIYLVAVFVSINVETQIARFARVPARSNLTARQLVEQIILQNHLNVRLETADDHTGDHYDPRTKTVRLSAKIINSNSLSALAIAAHECGHAVQDAQNYAPLKIRQAVIKVSNFTSRLLTPLILLSIIGSIFIYTAAGFEFLKYLLLSFCIIYGLTALAGFVTLPTEYDASRRGQEMLDAMQITTDDTEKRAVKKVLRAAAATYVVSFAMSLVYFLRYLSYFMILFGGHDRS